MQDIGAFLGSHIFELIFTGIVRLLTWWVKRYLKLEREHNKSEQQKFREDILNEAQKDNKKLDVRINAVEEQLNHFLGALLSLQGSLFREFCEELLEPGRVITVDEFEQFENDYQVYKSLGGNHRGDTLHDSVVRKFNKHVQKEEIK